MRGEMSATASKYILIARGMAECGSIMQGHALFTRQAGGDLPCPLLDFTGGFNQFMAAAYNLTGKTVEEVYGAPFGECPMSQPLRQY